MDSETIEKVIQTCGSYQNQIPTQHWMLEDPLSDSLVMWAWWIDVSLGCLDKTNNMEMQYSKMQVGNKHTPQSTTVSRSVASKPEIVFWVCTRNHPHLMYQTTTPLDLELIPTETPHKQSNGQSKTQK